MRISSLFSRRGEKPLTLEQKEEQFSATTNGLVSVFTDTMQGLLDNVMEMEQAEQEILQNKETETKKYRESMAKMDYIHENIGKTKSYTQRIAENIGKITQ